MRKAVLLTRRPFKGAQEAILKAFRALARFRQESKFSTWLTQIVINEAKMRLRKDRRHLYESLENGPQGDDEDYVPRDVADWREIPSEALQNRELREMLRRAIESLPPKYRAVLVLRDVEHLTIREAADVLGTSEANVKTRLSRARLQARDIICSLRELHDFKHGLRRWPTFSRCGTTIALAPMAPPG